MSSRSVELLYSDNKRNIIPVGRQLPRTPPSQNCVKQLDLPSEQPHLTAEQTCNEETQAANITFDFRTTPVKPDDSNDPQSMVKGMKGYQLTPADLEFMQKLKEEKEIKKVQEELKTAQHTLKGEMMVLELALASMEKAQAELKLLPPCEDIRRWSEVLLGMSVPSSDLSELDTKALLALVTQSDAKKAIQDKKGELKRIEKMVEKKKKNAAKERGLLEKQIAIEQSKLLSLMNKLAELKSALHKEDVNKSLNNQVDEKTSLRGGKTKQKCENAASTSKRTRQTNQRQKSEPALRAQKIRPDAPKRDWSSPAPADKSTTPSESRNEGRMKVAADQGERGQRRTQQRTSSDTPAFTCGRRNTSVLAPAEEQNLGLRRSRRIACQK